MSVHRTHDLMSEMFLIEASVKKDTALKLNLLFMSPQTKGLPFHLSFRPHFLWRFPEIASRPSKHRYVIMVSGLGKYVYGPLEVTMLFCPDSS